MLTEYEISEKLQKIESLLGDKYRDEGAEFYPHRFGGATNEGIFQINHLRDTSINSYWQRLTITVRVDPASGDASVSLITGKWVSGITFWWFGYRPPLGEYEKDLLPEFQIAIDDYKSKLEAYLR